VTSGLGPASGWIALVLIPLTAVAGWLLGRYAKGRFASRMRPHAIAGYAVLAFTIVHLSMSMGGMAGADSTGIWLATFALFVLVAQALIGANLQSPGGYRIELHRWHIVAFAAVLLLASGHVLYNRPAASMLTSSATNRRSDRRLESIPVPISRLAAARSYPQENVARCGGGGPCGIARYRQRRRAS
jgi:hypothetical protein